MPWLVSMRISGQVMGARAITSTRRSVIFRSEGLELVLTFCGCASRRSSAQNAAPIVPAARLRKERRPFEGETCRSASEERRLKAGCSQDWLPHKEFFIISLLLSMRLAYALSAACIIARA